MALTNLPPCNLHNLTSYNCDKPYPNCISDAGFQFASLWLITTAVALCPNDTRLFPRTSELDQPMLTQESCQTFVNGNPKSDTWTWYPSIDIWVRLVFRNLSLVCGRNSWEEYTILATMKQYYGYHEHTSAVLCPELAWLTWYFLILISLIGTPHNLEVSIITTGCCFPATSFESVVDSVCAASSDGRSNIYYQRYPAKAVELSKACTILEREVWSRWQSRVFGTSPGTEKRRRRSARRIKMVERVGSDQRLV